MINPYIPLKLKMNIDMATQPISMNIIEQVLIRLSQKESIRSIAASLHISKYTVSRYKALSEADPL